MSILLRHLYPQRESMAKTTRRLSVGYVSTYAFFLLRINNDEELPMTQNFDIETVLNVATQIVTAAGCAALITTDESGLPSSRPVRAFPSDDEFTKITIPTDQNSRKTHHVRNNSHVVLSYIDTTTRGYVTVVGEAVLNDRLEDKIAAWAEPFSSFWPGGPESEEYLLIDLTPQRMEIRSYTQGVAEEPTHWVPVTLERAGTGGWQQTG